MTELTLLDNTVLTNFAHLNRTDLVLDLQLIKLDYRSPVTRLQDSH